MATTDEIFDDASGDVAIGDLASAAEKYRRCVEIDPDFFDGWHALGMAHAQRGDKESARKYLEAYLGSNPEVEVAAEVRAVLGQMGRAEEE